MSHHNTVTDAELDIMKVLWRKGALTSPDIFAAMEEGKEKSRGTLKTLLSRLVQKGAVRCEEVSARHYLYIPVLTKEEYIKENRRRLIDRVFDGSVKKLLLNFIKEEKITREDLEQLIKLIEED